METPPTIHDFGGFAALYALSCSGSPALAQHLVELLAPVPVELDKEAGL
ncbi:4,5-DOPA dioxygenase extradiol [Escherichia coli]|nr:4,5-DOPA dioxygenase extradiol [Escherichia coli]